MEEIYGDHWEQVKDHIDEEGWFIDDILGDDIWVLYWCRKKMVNGKMYWRHRHLDK